MAGPRVVIFTDDPGWHGRMLVAACAARKVEAVYASLKDCRLDLDGTRAHVAVPGFDAGLPAAAFVRGVAGGSLEQVVLRLDILHALSLLDVPVFNTGRAIERTVDKALTSFLLIANSISTPRTWAIESSAAAHSIATRVFEQGSALVMKPLFGSQGEGLVKLIDTADFDQAQPVNGVYYLQEYIDRGGPPFHDVRVLVIAGSARFAMSRESLHWITNRAQGARCTHIELQPEIRALAERAAAAVDIDYAGVDLLQDAAGKWWVGEVNGIPAWWGLQQACGEDVTAALVEAFLAKSALSV